jgi:hypothetical protein
MGSAVFCPQVSRELAGGQGVAKLELLSDPADAGGDAHVGEVDCSKIRRGKERSRNSGTTGLFKSQFYDENATGQSKGRARTVVPPL